MMIGFMKTTEFGKYDLLDAILDLYEEKFDSEFYTNYIKTNYENYITQFI